MRSTVVVSESMIFHVACRGMYDLSMMYRAWTVVEWSGIALADFAVLYCAVVWRGLECCEMEWCVIWCCTAR